MPNAHRLSLVIALAAAALSFAAQAQTVTVGDAPLAFQADGTALPQPLSLTQPYVPSADTQKPEEPLRLLVDEPVADEVSAADAMPATPAPLARAEELGTEPAINALDAAGADRFALTVSNLQRPAR